MNAGPELNALIAERVMGHTVAMAPAVWSGEDWIMSDSPTARNVLAIINADFTPGASFPPAYPILDFSGDIAAAWQVVEKLRARGLRLSLDGFGGDPWWAEFADDAYEVGGQATGTTAPHAICLAALKVVAP